MQTSLYAASKLAGEGFIHAYCEGYGFEGYIFRFVSILGERYTHGHVLDFYKQLLAHPGQLKVLGDGKQQKSYLYIGDCLDAMLHVVNRATAKSAKHGVETYNLGTEEYVQVNDSIRFICARSASSPNWNTPAATRAGSATTRSFFSTPKKSAPPAGKPR
jgi:UDP-glucose 4-epimerase